jgi:hypothetical protein
VGYLICSLSCLSLPAPIASKALPWAIKQTMNPGGARYYKVNLQNIAFTGSAFGTVESRASRTGAAFLGSPLPPCPPPPSSDIRHLSGRPTANTGPGGRPFVASDGCVLSLLRSPFPLSVLCAQRITTPHAIEWGML